MISLRVTLQEGPLRIDAFLAHHFPEYTRTFLKKLIISGKIQHNGMIVTKASLMVKEGDAITVTAFELPKRVVNTHGLPDYCSEHLVFEHEHFLVVEKPSGLITHQTEHPTDLVTLSDILTHQRPEIADVGQEGRHGIVHRLDRDTSGLLIIARTQHGYETFINHFKNRTIKKTYIAVVSGHPPKTGSATMAITRHPADSRKMICTPCVGRDATTDYEVLEYFDDYSLVRLRPLTGRTHQIRVHMASIGHPVIGDSLYGTHSKKIKRQALHAQKLEFEFDGAPFLFESDLPNDIKVLLATQPTVVRC